MFAAISLTALVLYLLGATLVIVGIIRLGGIIANHKTEKVFSGVVLLVTGVVVIALGVNFGASVSVSPTQNHQDAVTIGNASMNAIERSGFNTTVVPTAANAVPGTKVFLESVNTNTNMAAYLVESHGTSSCLVLDLGQTTYSVMSGSCAKNGL